MALSRSVPVARQLIALSLLSLAAASTHAQARFTVSADGQEVLDTTSGLSWRRCPEGQAWKGDACDGKMTRFTYAAAKQEAASVAKRGAKPWRLPERAELVALVDQSAKKKPRVDAKAFPKAATGPYWASREGSGDNLNAWLVRFDNGKVHGNVGQAKFPLRLVRKGS